MEGCDAFKPYFDESGKQSKAVYSSLYSPHLGRPRHTPCNRKPHRSCRCYAETIPHTPSVRLYIPRCCLPCITMPAMHHPTSACPHARTCHALGLPHAPASHRSCTCHAPLGLSHMHLPCKTRSSPCARHAPAMHLGVFEELALCNLLAELLLGGEVVVHSMLRMGVGK